MMQIFYTALCVLIFTTCVSLRATTAASSPLPLYFGYIISGNSSDFGGVISTADTVTAVDLALRRINSDPHLLTGYELRYQATLDSQCNRRKALDAFIREVLSTDHVDVALLGCGCSAATEAVAEIVQYWSLPQISYASSSADLQDRERFMTHFQMYPPDDKVAPAIATLLHYYGWRRISTITEKQDTYLQLETQMEVALQGRNISLIEPVQFETHENLDERDDLFAEDVRIFLLNVSPSRAAAIMCKAYRKDFSYPQYVWITHGWYPEQWWNVSQEIYGNQTETCSSEELAEFLNGVIAVQPYPNADDRYAETESGITAEEFEDWYENEAGRYTFLATLAYDAVWALALALNNTQEMIRSGSGSGIGPDLGCKDAPGQIVPLHEFTYNNTLMGCLIQRSIQDIAFTGVSGQVEFNSNGSRVQDAIKVLQYRHNSGVNVSQVLIGYVNTTSTQVFVYVEGHSNGTVFPDGIPNDGTPIKGINVQPLWLVIPYYILSLIGIIFAIVCLLFNFIYRKRRIVRLTSPNLNYYIIVGSLCLYGSIYIRIYPASSELFTHARCNIQNILGCIGYVLCFAPVLVKMWRVYYIFHNPSPRKKAVKDWHLTTAVMVISAVIFLMSILSAAVTPLRPDLRLRPDVERPSGVTDDGITINYCAWECYNSRLPFIWLALEYGYMGLLQIAAVILAFTTRRVKIKVLNDSKSVAVIIYTTSVVLVALVIISFTLDSYIVVTEILFSGGIMLATTVFLAFIFIPKMITLRKDPKGETVFDKSTNFSSIETGESTLKRTTDSDNVATLTARIKQLETELNTYKAKPHHSQDSETSGLGEEIESTATCKL